MLVLSTVLFAAAWRSDHPGRERLVSPLSRTGAPETAASAVALSAASMGEALPSCAATRLATPKQSNGLTWQSDQGLSAALGRSFALPADKQSGPTWAAGCGGNLGSQLAVARCTWPIAGHESTPVPALLSGTLENSASSPPAAMNSVPDLADAAAGAHESVAPGPKAAAPIVR
jgi:hypothetical protein